MTRKGNNYVAVDEMHSKQMALGAFKRSNFIYQPLTGNAGSYGGDCISNPSLCTNGLSVAFWLNYGGVYVYHNLLIVLYYYRLFCLKLFWPKKHIQRALWHLSQFSL